MNLHRLLIERAEEGAPVRVGLIGAGKFGTMFLAQAARTRGLHVMGVADLECARATQACLRAGWPEERFEARSFDEARATGQTCLADEPAALIRAPGLDVIVEATGDPAAGIAHALLAIGEGRHVVMVTVEADALAGALLARRAEEAGLVYSLAYGDQPALICELVDWARACAFDVVCAGKGTRYLPAYHASTPEVVWQHYGFSEETVLEGDFNARMFNSFLDGSKSAIEMAAVANATGLEPAAEGLAFPPCGVDELAEVCRPRSAGGRLGRAGTVEVVSSLERDGRPVAGDLRWGVFVTFEAASDYVRRCFAEYGLKTDSSGRYAALYRPYHLIGLELAVSVASVALRREPTGRAQGFRADVVTAAKRDLEPGEVLDGEGGYTVYGKLKPAALSLEEGALPLGLSRRARLTRPVAAGELVRWSDVEVDTADGAVAFRREMEAAVTPAAG
ncbi:MAG: NAD(P)H-dependent oxidoreductase [Alphaproteobacteria bacterium]